MKQLFADQVRRAFTDYFEKNGHQLVASSSLIPDNDPTLMFVNAGMVQFKDVFTGRAKRSYTRATSCQKCMRISGKHNDLENVGRTARHHTFFEMLGNFSFGDYFKEQAIAFAWEFLTKELQLPAERLAITIFGGEGQIAADDEARTWWKKISGLNDERIHGLGYHDNFWQMGETGPCGPCSEVHYFVGNNVDISLFGQDPDDSGRGWIEIWNLVFTQFERSIQHDEVTLLPLPRPCVDTGAGLERLSAVMQQVPSNYDCDLLLPLVKHAGQIASKTYMHSKHPDDVSMRVIADHARSTAFLIASGVLPDRDGRSYVLRRVMRRAVRHGHRLGITEPFLHEIAMDVVNQMGSQYPELKQHESLIADVTRQEELRFRRTLDNGLRLLEEQFSAIGADGSDLCGQMLSGETAFKLHDTFGFPLDLTELICQERNVQLDREGYDRALAQAQQQSRGSELGDKAVAQAYYDAIGMIPQKQVQFVGYDSLEQARCTVVAIIVNDNFVQHVEAGMEAWVVLDITPFYAESGGQQADQGVLVCQSKLIGTVLDTQGPLPGLVVHRVKLAAKLSVKDEVTARVDETRRNAIRRNHTATHLLHFALRSIVGSHATQKGSLVGPDRLRFDFTHSKALTPEQLTQMEDMVNAVIVQNAPVQTRWLPLQQARNLGAMAIFGDKYSDIVRMVTVGSESLELCGGTHVSATGEIGLFRIVSESGIAAGVRRIEAVTGLGTLALLRSMHQQLEAAAQALKTQTVNVADKIVKMLQREKQLEKQLDTLKRQLTMGCASVDDMLQKATQLAGIKVLSVKSQLADAAALRELADKLRDKLGDSVVIVGAAANDKAMLAVTVSKPLTSRVKAGEIIRLIAPIIGGKGGGRADMAQAGGQQIDKLDEAIAAAPGIINDYMKTLVES